MRHCAQYCRQSCWSRIVFRFQQQCVQQLRMCNVTWLKHRMSVTSISRNVARLVPCVRKQKHYCDSQYSANSDISMACCEIGFSLPSIKTNQSVPFIFLTGGSEKPNSNGKLATTEFGRRILRIAVNECKDRGENIGMQLNLEDKTIGSNSQEIEILLFCPPNWCEQSLLGLSLDSRGFLWVLQFSGLLKNLTC